MSHVQACLFFTAFLFTSMLLLLEVGRRFGEKHRLEEGEIRAGLGVVEGAVFSLLGLLMAFTFSGAVTRFDARRQLIVQEANCIDTAYKRIDLLVADAQPALRELFRKYLDSRLEAYRKIPDISAAQQELKRSLELQDQIWNQSMAACRQTPSPSATTLVTTALNQMMDVTTTRTMALQIHPPMIIFAMLGLLALAAALLAGYGMAGVKQRHWLYFIGFPTIISLTVFVTLDMEYPRLGFIRIDSFDQVLVDLRQTMN